ncbi:MAG: haloperoxidase, partial [Ferruginibacter sp.]
MLSSLLLMVMIAACKTKSKKENIVPAAYIDTVVRRMSDLMVHDVTNPPLAARFFAYTFLAGYEVVSQNNSLFKSMKGILNDYPAIKKPAVQKYNYHLAALLATIETASRIQPSGKQLQTLKEKLLEQAEDEMDEETITGSVTYASAIVDQIMKYARADGYRKFSDYPRYTPVVGEAYWFPTPPAYIAAVEPYFSKLRPFLLDSCTQFQSAPPVPFDKNKSSLFYALMDSVYETGEHLSRQQQEIAAFWDCNPFALNNQGHLSVGIKKISPGAHWMGIAGIACTQQHLSFDSSMMVHSLLALTLTDAFICCWDEKYRSNR